MRLREESLATSSVLQDVTIPPPICSFHERAVSAPDVGLILFDAKKSTGVFGPELEIRAIWPKVLASEQTQP